jgi:hypothetical protein
LADAGTPGVAVGGRSGSATGRGGGATAPDAATGDGSASVTGTGDGATPVTSGAPGSPCSTADKTPCAPGYWCAEAVDPSARLGSQGAFNPLCGKAFCIPNDAIACGSSTCTRHCCTPFFDAGAELCDLDRTHRVAVTPASTDGTCQFECQGACSSGHCLTTVVSTLLSPGALAVDDTSIYWLDVDADGGTYSVKKASTDGALQTTLATRKGSVPVVGNPMALDDRNVYWGEVTPSDGGRGGGAILAVPLDGGPITTLGLGVDTSTRVKAHGSFVYWSSSGGSITRAPKSGGPPTAVLTGVENLQEFDVDDAHVYFDSGYAVQDVWMSQISRSTLSAPDGGAATILASGLGDEPRNLTVVGGALYFIQVNVGVLSSIPVRGGAVTVLTSVAGTYRNLPAMVFDGAKLYLFESAAAVSHILAFSVDASPSMVEDVAFEGSTRGSMAANGTSLFWTNADSCNGMIMKLFPK